MGNYINKKYLIVTLLLASARISSIIFKAMGDK